jgi:hypothetical protein
VQVLRSAEWKWEKRKLSGEVELGDFEVAGLGYFEVAAGAGDYVDGNAGAFEEAGFVGAEELVGGGFGEGAAEKGDAGALRGLGVDDEFAGDGGGRRRRCVRPA